MLQLRCIIFSHIHIHTTLTAQLRDLYNVPHTHHNLTLCATMLMSSGARRSPHRKGASTRYHGLAKALFVGWCYRFLGSLVDLGRGRPITGAKLSEGEKELSAQNLPLSYVIGGPITSSCITTYFTNELCQLFQYPGSSLARHFSRCAAP